MANKTIFPTYTLTQYNSSWFIASSRYYEPVAGDYVQSEQSIMHFNESLAQPIHLALPQFIHQYVPSPLHTGSHHGAYVHIINVSAVRFIQEPYISKLPIGQCVYPYF